MATRAAVEKLPYGIGRWSAGWIAIVGLSLAVLALGVFAFARQMIEGEVVTGLRNLGSMGGATWGLYVAFIVYFGGVSFAGITIVALIRLFNLEHLRPIARMSLVLAVISIILAALSVLVDLGQPFRALINLPLYGRPMSPFFGTFTVVISGYLFAGLVYLYLNGRRDAAICAEQSEGALQKFYRLWAAGYRDTPAERQRHRRTTFWLAIAILPLLLTATSTLGFVFGLQAGRPGWFSALHAPGFVTLAGVSGVGHIIVLAAVLRRVLGAEDQLNPQVFQWLSNLLMILTITYLYFWGAEWLTSTYAAHHHEVRISTALLTGEYAGLFWLSVGSLVVASLLLARQFLTGKYGLGGMVFSGLLVNVAAIGKRILIVVPSQTHGTLLPYGTGLYSPTWVEYSVILGLLALGALLYILFMKVFPIIEIPQYAGGGR
ncbi:MAG: NrfD/PsrC family molybdoenzyme membrane anchor subunit [Candidatus Methylomirabilales bacterium]